MALSNPYKIPDVTVASPGTKVQLTSQVPANVVAGDLVCSAIQFQARDTNAGAMYVGDKTVTSTNYFLKLSPGEEKPLASWQANVIQPETLYVDADNGGDKLGAITFRQ